MQIDITSGLIDIYIYIYYSLGLWMILHKASLYRGLPQPAPLREKAHPEGQAVGLPGGRPLRPSLVGPLVNGGQSSNGPSPAVEVTEVANSDRRSGTHSAAGGRTTLS